MYRGTLVVERYFLTDDARHLAAGRAGGAAARGHGDRYRARRRATSPASTIPVARYLPEWDDEARGRITLRQLLEETSGLETGGDTRGLLYRSPWRDPASLPVFATSRGVRMLLGNDFESSALGFRLEHEPGGFYNLSPANTQLAAVIIERVTGEPYENFVDERLWRPVGAGIAELQLDRRAGMPAAHCCWRATARDMLRILSLLGTDGVHEGRAVLPAGWVREMARRFARECRNRHAGGAAQHRWRRSTGSQGRRRQRVLGHSAAAARHPQHREPGRQRGHGPARHVVEGGRGAGARPSEGRKYRVEPDERGAQNARHGYESHIDCPFGQTDSSTAANSRA